MADGSHIFSCYIYRGAIFIGAIIEVLLDEICNPILEDGGYAANIENKRVVNG